MEGKFELQFEDNEYYLVDGNTNDTVATTDKVLLKEYDGYMKKLSIKNCQAIENGYDLDELAKEACNITDPLRLDSQKYKQDPYFRIGFNKGFQKALEILGDKKFNYDHLDKMFTCGKLYQDSKNEAYCFDNVLNKFQQTEWDVSFNPEEKDSEGCLILKRL